MIKLTSCYLANDIIDNDNEIIKEYPPSYLTYQKL